MGIKCYYDIDFPNAAPAVQEIADKIGENSSFKVEVAREGYCLVSPIDRDEIAVVQTGTTYRLLVSSIERTYFIGATIKAMVELGGIYDGPPLPPWVNEKYAVYRKKRMKYFLKSLFGRKT